MKTALPVLFFFAFTLAASAQSAQPSNPAFEVASIKPLQQLPPNTTGFGAVTQDPGMISIKAVSLQSLLRRAYGLQAFQIDGPDWLNTQCYDVIAKLPAGATKDQIPAMLQQLITERFRATLRWDAKQVTGYAIVVDKGGPKLTLSANQSVPDPDQPDKPLSVSFSDKIRMQDAPIAALATMISAIWRVPAVDSTGLQGRYDITLNVSFSQMAAALRGPSASASDDGGYTPAVVFDAFRDIGLRLQPQKMELKKLIVVSADRIPTEN